MRGALSLTASTACCALLFGACGGGTESADLSEASGDFQVKLVRADFASRQHVADTQDLVLAVQNTGGKALPELTVTLWTGAAGTGASKPSGSFNVQLSDLQTRPAWVPTVGFPRVQGSGENAGADAAQTDSYVFGPLKAGASKTVVWRVTPVRPGSYTLHYSVSAGVRGTAKAVSASGEPVGGTFRVRIDRRAQY